MLKIQVIGHLGKDAVVKTVNGKSVINFSVASTEKYKDAQGNLKENTTWVFCDYWIDNTNVAQYLKKGTQIYIEGKPSADFYNAGGNIGITGQQKCKVRNIQLLNSAKGTGQPQQEQRGKKNEGIPVHSVAHTTNGGTGYAQDYQNPNEITEPVDDLPF